MSGASDTSRGRLSGGWLDLAIEVLGGTHGPGTAWMRDAVCAQTDPDAFFPEKGQSSAAARLVCRGCPVRDACREWANATDQRHGVWGELTSRQLRQSDSRSLSAPKAS